MWVKTLSIFLKFCYLNIPRLRINITLLLLLPLWDAQAMNSRISRKSQKRMVLFFRRPYLCPSEGHQHGVFIQSFLNLGKSFFRISHIWNIAQTSFLARLFYINPLSFPRFWTFCIEWFGIFIFDGVTVKIWELAVKWNYDLQWFFSWPSW